MQLLLTLAGSLFLVAYATAASVQGQPGPCTKERQLGTEMPGKFLPQCTEYGYYNAKQCHGSTGHCWCVVPDTGKEITGTRVGPGSQPQCTLCYEQRALALRPIGHVGNFVPTCDENGQFTAKQFHGSTGFAWCVDQSTGAEVEGTRVRGQVECNGPVAAASFIALDPDMDTKGPCDVEVAQKRTRIGTIGLFMPHCTGNGYYKTEQMHSSTGYRWCVNPETGAEVAGTRKAPAAGKLECGACFKQIEEKLRRQPVMGHDIPKCDEIGNYVPEQSREGHRFCVNPTTGAVEGKILAPGDMTKLDCKH